MTLGIPQVIFLVFIVLNLGISLAKNGEPQGDYSFLASLIGATISFSLLYWGGFFK